MSLRSKSVVLLFLSGLLTLLLMAGSPISASAASAKVSVPTEVFGEHQQIQGGPGFIRSYSGYDWSGEYGPIKQYLFEHRRIAAKAFSGYDPITKYQYTHDPFYRWCLDRGGTIQAYDGHEGCSLSVTF
ncbi:hypothetical protein [Ktedonospora formicarum]|uniref:Uncharacterized protein n=1 Tax=Ktedonospora formicarum TaxID=2778364 RepID=A0A8J3I7N3_9CHLR|nr:hypothetical protein [Ktedonospora formicarum]GHO47313.1 hypothetical protein KSX_54760 [Ktedonospora formicarum]